MSCLVQQQQKLTIPFVTYVDLFKKIKDRI